MYPKVKTKKTKAQQEEAKLHEELHSSMVDKPNGQAVTCPYGMTDRENDVYCLMITGMNNVMIAQALGITVKTLDIHRANVFKKTGCNNNGHLIYTTVPNAKTMIDAYVQYRKQMEIIKKPYRTRM